MSLPKKFNETINFKNKINSLNELIFYTVEYDYVLTENCQDNIVEGFVIDKEITGVKEFHALDEEQAGDKIKNWFIVLKDKEILKSFEVISIKSKSFYEIVKEKKLLNI